MAVRIPDYLSELQGFKDGGRKDALGLFMRLGRQVQQWQCAQYRSWTDLQQRPLEPWMRQFIAAQWTEFLDSVFWNIPALEATVELARSELEELQADRFRAILRREHGDIEVKRSFFDIVRWEAIVRGVGPVIYGLDVPDHDSDAVEDKSRSVLDTLKLVHQFTVVDGELGWVDTVVVPDSDRRIAGIDLDWRHDTDTSGEESDESDDPEQASEVGDEDMGQEADVSVLAANASDDAMVGASELPTGECGVPGSPVYSEVPDDFVVPMLAEPCRQASFA